MVVLNPIFRRCSNRYCKNKHEHEHLEGSAKGHGSRTHLAQVYPYRLCQALADCFGKFFNVRPSDRCTSLYTELVDDFSDKECQSLIEVFQSSVEHDFLNINTINMKDLPFDTNVTSAIVEDSCFARMSRAIAQVSNACELDMISQSYEDSRIQAIVEGCTFLRSKFLPHYSFDQCYVYRNTLGTNKSLVSPPDLSVLFAWHKDSPTRGYALTASACYRSGFQPSGWTFVLFVNRIGPPPAPFRFQPFPAAPDDPMTPPDLPSPPTPPVPPPTGTATDICMDPDEPIVSSPELIPDEPPRPPFVRTCRQS